MFKVNNRNSRKSCEISSKLTIKIPQYVNYIVSGVFMVSSERISHLSQVFIIDFEQINVCWDVFKVNKNIKMILSDVNNVLNRSNKSYTKFLLTYSWLVN